MKKVLMIAAIAVLGLSNVNAQDDNKTKGFAKEDVFISGTVGFSSSKQGSVKENGFTIAPKVGYFISDNFALGLKVEYGSLKNKASGTTVSDIQTLTLGAFGRYYMTPENQFSMFAELGVDYNSSDDKLLSEGKFDGFTIGFAPGISYFVSSHFAIEASIGVLNYDTSKSEVSGSKSTDTFNIGLDFDDVSIGVVYKF